MPPQKRADIPVIGSDGAPHLSEVMALTVQSVLQDDSAQFAQGSDLPEDGYFIQTFAPVCGLTPDWLMKADEHS